MIWALLGLVPIRFREGTVNRAYNALVACREYIGAGINRYTQQSVDIGEIIHLGIVMTCIEEFYRFLRTPSRLLYAGLLVFWLNWGDIRLIVFSTRSLVGILSSLSSYCIWNDQYMSDLFH